jgi:endonuclease/exonuclease/phosphatase family metal-dependent hydrolase
MRGFGRSGRRTQLHDFIRKEQLDIIFLQETMPQDFTDHELRGLVNGELFHWHWRAVVGRSGGMLLGIKDETIEVGSIDQGPFFLSASVLHRDSKFKFEFVGVYGPVDHTRSASFLNDLENKVENCAYPVVVLGDFNLIRGAQDKNNANINWPLVNAFNDSIARLALREVACTSARYIWSNRQHVPVRCVLDRVLVSPKWETQFPLTLLRDTTCLGLDHSTLVLDTGSSLPKRTNRFFFEASWLSLPGFIELVKERWIVQADHIRRCRGPIDWWHSQSSDLRQFQKGWSANLGKDSKDAKATLLARIQQLDSLADGVGLDKDGWALRYHLEGQMMEMLSREEEY